MPSGGVPQGMQVHTVDVGVRQMLPLVSQGLHALARVDEVEQGYEDAVLQKLLLPDAPCGAARRCFFGLCLVCVRPPRRLYEERRPPGAGARELNPEPWEVSSVCELQC